MGFNISQIVNKFIPTKRIDDDLRENPFNTEYGQEIVSIQENFWARLYREGMPKLNTVSGVTVTNASSAYAYYGTITPSLGRVLYPKQACITCNEDAELTIKVDTGIKDVLPVHVALGWVKAGTPLQTMLDGELFCLENGMFTIGIKTASPTAKVYGCVYGIEVTKRV